MKRWSAATLWASTPSVSSRRCHVISGFALDTFSTTLAYCLLYASIHDWTWCHWGAQQHLGSDINRREKAMWVTWLRIFSSSLFCWEILFQEANRIWQQKPYFQALIWPRELRYWLLPVTTLPLLDKLFLLFLNIFTWLKHSSIFSLSLFLFNNVILIRNQLLADVFLFVLSQFRRSHIRPLGAIYSLTGFCKCAAQTFFYQWGPLRIVDRHQSKYGTHHICGTDAIVFITQGSIINNLQQEMLQRFRTRVLGPATVAHEGCTVILCAGSGLREKKWNSD